MGPDLKTWKKKKTTSWIIFNESQWSAGIYKSSTELCCYCQIISILDIHGILVPFEPKILAESASTQKRLKTKANFPIKITMSKEIFYLWAGQRTVNACTASVSFYMVGDNTSPPLFWDENYLREILSSAQSFQITFSFVTLQKDSVKSCCGLLIACT